MIRAKFANREAVMARLRKVAPNAEREIAKAQLDAARGLAEAIRARAPVDTGRYRESLEADLLRNRKAASIGGGRKSKDPNATGVFGEFIWRFLEFGTVNQPAQPHIFPTYRASKKAIRRGMRRALKNAIAKR